ncbi:hypothetical protein HAT86_06880 [Roseovarius gahaiensis]|uniref:Uncharacterized protein n=1 Tax=Roseovarius gahaiensis TaxID=2716691 RepID=A0A967BGC4_9RHOB|nr:hypothetical protein [Roseovarius gahaiensis]NHQ74188.1 hypothetical protein [Roseovarius gahaiensis]
MVSEKVRQERAEQLRVGLEAVKRLEGRKAPMREWSVMANHVFHIDREDGLEDESTAEFYEFTEIQKNRFLAHAREDAAFAVYAAHDAYQEICRARKLVTVSLLLNVVVLCLLSYELIG